MRIYEYLSRIVKDHPWAIIIVSLLLTIGLGLGLLSIQGELSYQGMLPRGFPSIKALDDLDKHFGGIAYEQALIRAPDVIDSRISEFLVLLETYINKDPRFNKGQIQYETDSKGRRVLDVLGQPVPIIQDYLTPFIAGAKKDIAASSPIKDLSYATNANLKDFTGKDYEQTIREQYLSVPEVRDQMVGKQKFLTPDYKATEIMIKVGSRLTDTAQVKLANDLENLFKTKLAGVPGIRINIAGDATLARDFDLHIKNKTILLFVLSIIFVLITLFLAFRRTTDTIIPIAVMVMSLVWTFGLMGYLRIPYSVASVAIMPLLLGHALTFVVPFIARYYEEAEHLLGSVAAVGRAMRTVGVALFPAAATSVVGFLVFEFSILPPLRDFGVASALGTAFIFVLALTLLPAVMVIRDRRLEADGPLEEREKFRTHFDGFTRRQEHSLFARGTDRALQWCSDLATKHSVLVIVISTVLIIAALLSSFGLTTDSDLRKLVPKDLSSIHTDFLIEKEFGPDQTDVIMVGGDVLAPKSIKAMADLETAIFEDRANTFNTYDRKARRYVKTHHYDRKAITGLPDVVTGANNGQLPATEAQVKQALELAAGSGGYVGGVLSPDNKYALISLNGLAAQSAKQIHVKMAMLRGNSKKMLTPAGLTFELGGITPITDDMTRNIIPTETWSSILSLIICGLLLILIFRSIPYGLITLTVGVAGVAATIGFLTLMRWPIDVITSLVSALVIAVGSNFGILFTHRYIQEMKQGQMLPVESIRSTMHNLGRANVVAALSTVAGFLIIMLSQIVPLKRFGGVIAFGIVWSLVASLTLMPALLYRMSAHRAMHEEEHIEEPEPEPATP